MNVRALAVLICALSCLGLFAADDFPIYVYPAPMAKTPPKIDGVLDDACWKDAPVVSGFIWYNKAEKMPVQTSFRVIYDAANLYFGVTCDEPRMDLLNPKPAPHDSMEVFQTEAIELFIEPQHGSGDYYQVAANAAGAVYDSHRTDPTWDSGAVAVAGRQKNAWTLEVAIPWKGMGVNRVESGMNMSFNVCRDRTLADAREWSCWAQVAANFHDPAHFANLALSPTPEQLGKLGPEFRKGDRTGPLLIFSNEGFSKTSYKALATAALTRTEELIRQLDAIRAGERDSAAAAELQKRLSPIREAVDACRRQVADEGFDAAAWARMDAQIEGLRRELAEAVWNARLSALFQSI
jgi:hypothetical protein